MLIAPLWALLLQVGTLCCGAPEDAPGTERPEVTAPDAPVPSTPSTPADSVTSRWVTGYYVGYQRDLYPETSIDFGYITHIIVGAIQPTMDGSVDPHFYIDVVNGPAMAKSIADRAHKAGRKALVMIGGDGWHAQMVAATSNANRAKFVSTMMLVLDTLHFDGIDIDWEPIEDADKPVIIQFIKDLRAARPGIIISFPAGWVNTNFGADPWYVQLAPLVDQLNLMSYQMAGNWGGWLSWHGSALFGEGGDHPTSISGSVKAYTKVGVPAARIGVGVGAYGSCWQGVSTMLQKIDGTRADVVAGDNDVSYATIMSRLYNESAYKWDSTAQIGYLSFPVTSAANPCSMVSYDDPRSVALKGAYVKSQGLGGIMMWTINEQHMPAAAAGQQDPLLRAAYTSMQ